MNELNELQTYKLVRTDVTLILYAIAMEGFGLKYWTSHDPDLNRVETNSPSNYTLFFFVTACLIYTIGILQYVVAYGLRHWVPLRHEEFVDLCSITNMSVLMFDESFHGYYIHGRSPYGQAEISTEKLKKALEFEASGKAQIRGLSEANPSMQTFEIFIPRDLLKEYKLSYLQDVQTQIQKRNNENQNTFNSVQKALAKTPAIPQGLDIESLELQKRNMNKIMMKYVE